jgi:hypothetical protein
MVEHVHPNAGEPVELLDAVMDRVKSPQPRDAVEQTVGDVKAQVG